MPSAKNFLGLLEKLQSADITVHQNRCAVVRNRNATCMKCAEVCTSGCISYNDNELIISPEKCIGCGMCSQACPWNMPRVDTETGVSTKCISCGRCAEQCPNGAIKFIDWEDIAQKAIDEGVVSTATIVEA